MSVITKVNYTYTTLFNWPNEYKLAHGSWMRRWKMLTRISCRWQTHMTRCIMANVLQINQVDTQCDKLVTKLSRQCFALKVANFQLPHLNLTHPPASAPLLGVTPFEFCQDFWHQKTRVPGLSCGTVCMILHLAISVEYRLVTDRWTDRHDDS